MTSQKSLLGLDRLLLTCEKYAINANLRQPWDGAPTADALIQGHPVDPMLAIFYSRLGGLRLDLDLYVTSCDSQVNKFLLVNEEVQTDWPEPFRSLVIFGGQEALAYTYATVPALANAQGLQPVVKVNPYEDLFALPLASNLDRFFDVYARYLEIIYENPDFRDEVGFRPVFPWDVSELIATDRTLMAMIVEGHFDSLMYNPATTSADRHKEIRRWIAELKAASP